MTKKLAKTDGYKILVSKIREELDGLELLIKRETVLRYWRVGEYISQHLLENKNRAGYGEHLIEDLAEDVDRDKTTLDRAHKLYRLYPISAPGHQLSWSHYRSLLVIEDKSERKRLERLAIARDWDSKELAKYIKSQKQKEVGFQSSAEIPQLAFTRGRLNSYRLLEPELPFDKLRALLPCVCQSTLLIDLGFQMRREFPEGKPLGFKTGDCIHQICKTNLARFAREARRARPPSASPRGERHSPLAEWRVEVQKISISIEELFTYVACVQKIIDGDTLWALIDCGFGMLIRQKLRLRGIDCPELSTAEGQRAKRFVQERLKGLDFIIIKTYKDRVDKYDRYLVDLFYSRDEKDPQKILKEGIFLNQELLDKGLARHFA
ncbi:MAG: thermonuclease family protein [Candidatus Omnitrophica bacterium]|nr:thermonuclease family protein [Candidatus Omnitrophota bacterium]